MTYDVCGGLLLSSRLFLFVLVFSRLLSFASKERQGRSLKTQQEDDEIEEIKEESREFVSCIVNLVNDEAKLFSVLSLSFCLGRIINQKGAVSLLSENQCFHAIKCFFK
jgi:hypothetical protein